MSTRLRLAILLALAAPIASAVAAPPYQDRPSFAYEADPYYPHKDYPKLTTPQWVGEEGVEGVVVLAVDDMSKPAIYETFLRPILERLKAIDGRAPVSIMTNQVDPNDPRIQGWLKEGLSIEVHTIGHPCPFFHDGDFAAAGRAYHGGVDLINAIPNNRPVAFRMPCCDSINSPGPRFFAELFNKSSPGGNFLSIDTSVFNIPTPDDASVPRSLVVDLDGREKFRKYLPFESFVNTIENYPYPYVIGGLCWEFPCAVPSDWEGQNIHKPNNPKTLEDMKAALDVAVLKKGVYNLVFHPHNWIQNTQVVELIDHAVKTHGRKVKFLNFREAQERLDRNLLAGRPLRNPRGADDGVELLDLNSDGFLDVARSHDGKVDGRLWKPEANAWETLDDAAPALQAYRAARPDPDQGATLPTHARRLDDQGRDAGLRFVDVDEDGRLDVVFSNDEHYGLFLFDPETKGWTRKVTAGKAGDPGALPKIVKGGMNNGFFVHSRSLWWQNEETDKLPDIVDRRSYNDLLRNVAPRGKTPDASLRSIRVAQGFRVELAASEPLVEDPIAIQWGADGRLWVLEMGDYPLGVAGRAGGVVRILEDQNGDGRYDKSTTFLDGLAYPSAMMPWRNGALIGCAPDLFFAEDRDGDGRADHVEILFTGFGKGNQQHRFNGFDLGLDGWVYGANGDSNGVVRSLKTGRYVSIQGRDFRFKPDTGEFETESGQTQYGRRRDDWGDWFGDNNPTWAWRYMFAESDLRRNPHFAAPDSRAILELDTRVHPISRMLARFNEPDSAGLVTSANSPTPYRDDLFGDRFRTSLFVSEPVHNLVHRMVVEPDGSASRGVRAPGEVDREFLASSDNWFRPTQLRTGPDGALWIADMYRAVIEHPEWIPPEVQQTIDLRAGSKEGRIYRVVPVDRAPRPIERLDRLDAAGLVAALDSPNGWRRDTAQRLLLHKGEKAAVEPLLRLIAESRSDAARVQAVWTLSLLGGLDDAKAAALLKDPSTFVQTAVVQATRGTLSERPMTTEALLTLDDSASPRLRFHRALALGDCKDGRAAHALAEIVRADPLDRWLRAAVLSSALPHVVPLLVDLLSRGDGSIPDEVVEPLVAMAGAIPDRAGLDSVLKVVAASEGSPGKFEPWKFSALAGFLRASARGGRPIEPTRENGILNVIDAARTVAASDDDETTRRRAISLVGWSALKSQGDRDLIIGLIAPREAIGVQEAAIEALGRTSDPGLPKALLKGWKGFSPAVRSSALDLVVSRDAWANALLDMVDADAFPRAEIDSTHRASLLASRNEVTRARAEDLFAKADASRKAVLDSYRPALAQKGDPSAGRSVFQRACATCHKVGELGVDVGPDLAALKDRSPEALLTAILDPSNAFEAKYTSFIAATIDGRVFTGLIANESASSVVLRRAEGKEDVLLRADIDQLTSSGKSLMTEGLEKDLSPRDLADLVAFLSTLGARP